MQEGIEAEVKAKKKAEEADAAKILAEKEEQERIDAEKALVEAKANEAEA